jgi:hypothetical protein
VHICGLVRNEKNGERNLNSTPTSSGYRCSSKEVKESQTKSIGIVAYLRLYRGPHRRHSYVP